MIFLHLKVNWNAETSWSLSQDFEALKTVSKEFLRNSFSFSRYGPLKSSFLLIRKVSEKGRENVRSIPRVTGKGAVTSEAIFDSLQVLGSSMIASCAMCQLLVEILQISLEYDFIEQGQFPKIYLGWNIDTLAVNVEPTNATMDMVNLTQTSTMIPQMIITRPITKTK